MRTLEEIDADIHRLFQERARRQIMEGKTSSPKLRIAYKFKVEDGGGEIAYFKTMHEAWSFFTNRRRTMNWRDAPAAFRLLGLKITKLTGEENETESKSREESSETKQNQETPGTQSGARSAGQKTPK